MQISRKRNVVTGGASGLGEAVAQMCAREGPHVALLDVQDEAGQRVVAEANLEGRVQAVYHHCDLRSR